MLLNVVQHYKYQSYKYYHSLILIILYSPHVNYKVGTPANENEGKSFRKNVKKRVGRGKKGRTPTSKEKKKTVQKYHRYIQKKKFTIDYGRCDFKFVTIKKKWVTTTGFGALLDFRMMCYTHNLGYNVVEAFNGEACLLVLQAGNINITESIVHSVMEFPNGTEVMNFGKDKGSYSE